MILTHNIWHERNNTPQTEQSLAEKICGIREEMERQIAPNEMREDQEEKVGRPDSQDEDSHNTPPAARSYEAEGNMKYLDNIKEWMQLKEFEKGSQRYAEINPHKSHHRNQQPSKTGSGTNGNKNTSK